MTTTSKKFLPRRKTRVVRYDTIISLRAEGRTPPPVPPGRGARVAHGPHVTYGNFFYSFVMFFKIFVKIFVHNEIYR